VRRTQSSQRDLVATLIAATESDDDQELEQLLVAHSLPLAEALCTTVSRLETLRRTAPVARPARLRDLIRAVKDEQQTANAAAMQNLALASAAMLAKLTCWERDRVLLDARIVLGRSLLADRARRYVRFDADGYDAVAVRREKLIDTSKALRFPDVTCALERRGLQFTWRGGVGRLLLTTQPIEPRHRDAVLSIVLEKPRPAVPSKAAAPVRERVSSWVPDVFGELSVF
jgi:hypothetical protein